MEYDGEKLFKKVYNKEYYLLEQKNKNDSMRHLTNSPPKLLDQIASMSDIAY